MNWAPQFGWSTLAAMLNSGRAVALRHHPTAQRLGRFALSSITVQVVYVALMAILLLALDLPQQTALPIGYAIAMGVHFTLNRQFVFEPADGYRHRLSAQGGRYLVTAIVVYVSTALGLALVPDALGLGPFVAWLLIANTIGAVNFVLLSRFVFR